MTTEKKPFYEKTKLVLVKHEGFLSVDATETASRISETPGVVAIAVPDYFEYQVVGDVNASPTRRVFYIDVGDMPPARAEQHLQQVKEKLEENRVDQPLAMLDDYYFAVSQGKRCSRVEFPGNE